MPDCKALLTGSGRADIGGILHGLGVTVACKASAVACSYALHCVLARLLGAEGFGIFMLAFAVTVSASFLGRFGQDYILLRRASICAGTGDTGTLAAWFRRSIFLSACAALLLTAAFAFSARDVCGRVFHNNGLYIPLLCMLPAVLPQALLFLEAETLKGVGRIRASQLLQGDGGGVAVYGAALCLAPLLGLAFGPAGACAGFSAASFFGMALGGRAIRLLLAGAPACPPPSYGELVRRGFPLFAAAVLAIAAARMGVVLLGAWQTAALVGIFAAAQKLSLLGSNVQSACCTVMGPRIARLHAERDRQALARYYGRGTLLVAALAGALLGCVALFAEELLALFGDSFVEGAPCLRLLAAGEMLTLLFGPTSIALIVTGHGKEHCRAVAVAVAVALAFGVVAVQLMGLAGAALATSLCNVLQTLIQARYIWNRLGFFPFPMK
ncbi:lipopolysaccharide biosynthesis protein [uncultured Desulfovibrio sp.]|uniref:lipopolysaccharide biosynthesis protein n=1 Tax=uncultured Desulfovibrio sp. TaxID=167968 RepID=UPI00263555AB|nr:lipopolysaccharide biosynthesis protein [uncultured Desulfovibrio sp.]